MKIKNLFLLLLVLASCKSNNEIKTKINEDMFSEKNVTHPPVFVYKTKNNYNNLVPVLLSDDKKEIISYPAPSDLKVGNKLLKPTFLQNGYLLDKKGINKNVAFLKYTYDEYSKFEYPPTLKVLHENILDKEPLLELYNCNIQNNEYVSKNYLNEIINNGELRTICDILMFTKQ